MLLRLRTGLISAAILCGMSVGHTLAAEPPPTKAAVAEPTSADEEAAQRQAVILREGSIRLKQRALRRLADLPGPTATRLIQEQFDALEAEKLPLPLWLDVLEAAGKRADPALKERLARREGELAAQPDPLRNWRECLEGGDASEGRAIFRERPEAGCIRCHRAQKEGGDIGPDLTAIAQRAQRISVLESILDPNAYIVPGFRSVLIKLKNGDEVSGVLTFESTEALHLVSPIDGKKTIVRSDDIEKETGLPSAMPPGYGILLGKRAIRDLIEYLFTQE